MARKPARKPAASKPSREGSAAPRQRPLRPRDREKIIAAFLALLAEKPIERIGFAEIAGQRRRVARAIARRIRLAARDPRRPHQGRSTAPCWRGFQRHGGRAAARAAVRRADAPARNAGAASCRRSVRCCARRARNPPLALALNGLAVRSQQWMLTAAGIGASGPRGMLRAQGLALFCSARCCAPGCATTIPAWPAPWRRSTGRWRAASALPASSTICASFRRACAGCGRAAAGDDDAEETAAA